MKLHRLANWLAVFLTITFGAIGCSRPLSVQESTLTIKPSQLPFDHASDSSGISPTSAFVFEAIPAGTEIAIRLRTALSSTDSHAGDSFEALLDEPLIFAGKTIAPRGAPVRGSVVDSKASAGQYDPGYLRITLGSVVIHGKPVALHTSSVFAKAAADEKRKPLMTNRLMTNRSEVAGNGTLDSGIKTDSPSNPGGDVTFSTGHRLTFRLTEPLHPES